MDTTTSVSAIGKESCHLIVDVREKRLCSLLTVYQIPFTTAALDVGDILIQNAEGEPLLVIERKSHADFAASNQDGRYREQRARLMAVRGSGVAVLYILEGVWKHDEERVYGSTTEAQLKRLTTRLILRYGIPVLCTESITDTAHWCQTFLNQLNDDPTVFYPDSSSAANDAMTGFTAALNTVKKGNKTPAGTAHAMISAVPGLGSKRVASLLGIKSIAELVTMSAADLAELTAGGKRLGPKLGSTLYDCFRAK
jgi:ERCC4-type nuclease